MVGGCAIVGWGGGGAGFRPVVLVVGGVVGVRRSVVVVGLPDGVVCPALAGVVVPPIDVVVTGMDVVVVGTARVVVGMTVVVVVSVGEGLVDRAVVLKGATTIGTVVVVMGSWLGLTPG
ncbi:hypothetical protein [Nocardia sp. NPDC059228]|uniref:hypothetical protein n=1 Tax=Nocardia sp. NPDC059228 TaxID=3346777 RepID=UPI00367979C0